MLANDGGQVKGRNGSMVRLVRAIVRLALRVALGAGLVAGAAAIVRAAIGRASGEPGVPGREHTPMSFDSWPDVPHAPAGDRG